MRIKPKDNIKPIPQKEIDEALAIEMKKIRAFIFENRHSKKYTISDMSFASGLSIDTICTLESNRLDNIKLKTLVALLLVFDIRMSDFFKEE